MALINCPECKKEVSDTVSKCTACGHQIRKPKRSAFGKVVKWVFILFNIFMIYSIFSGAGESSHVMQSAASDAERAGAAIGTGLGMMMLGTIWVIGDIILGMFVFFTRPKE